MRHVVLFAVMISVAALPGLVAILWQLVVAPPVQDRLRQLWRRHRRLCIALPIAIVISITIAAYYYKYWYNVGAAPPTDPPIHPLAVLLSSCFLAISSLPAWAVSLVVGLWLQKRRSIPGYLKTWTPLLIATLIWSNLAVVDLLTWPSLGSTPGVGGPFFEIMLVRAPIWFLVLAPGVALLTTTLATFPKSESHAD